MLESLRVRLLLWFTAILALVIAVFGAAVCYAFWRSLVEDLDGELRARAQVVAGALRPAAGGRFDLAVPEEALTYFNQEGTERPYYIIWSGTGELIDRSDPELDVPRPFAPTVRTRQQVRELAVPAAAGALVLVGQQTRALRRAVWSLAASVAALGAVAIALSLAGGWFLATRALRPIERISRTAQTMSRGDLSARIAIDRTETELEQVAVALNQAFDNLQAVLDRQRRFTADASHELRTPLSTLRTEAEWALSRDRAPAEYRGALEICQRAALRMQTVVEGLLTLARADAGELPLAHEPLAVHPVVDEAVALLRPLAERRQIAIHVAGGEANVRGDTGRLREAVTNLVSNAIRYNPDGGRVDIRIAATDRDVAIEVADTGPGIPPEAQPRLFDRFYRVDPSRARDGGGVGLGLAVTKWIVEAHGGTIACVSELGRGSSFTIRLPTAKTHKRGERDASPTTKGTTVTKG